jgi:uncharacterized protein YybS (DUF2232 family)
VPRTIDLGLTKDILNGIAIASLIFAISVYIPFLGSFGIYFLPLPIIFYRLKLGRGNGAIIPVTTFCFMAIIIGSISFELLFFFELLLTGFVLGELLELGLSIEKTILYTCCSVIVSAIFGLLIYSNMINTGIFETVSGYVAKTLEMVVVMYREIGMPEEDIQSISGLLETFQYILVRIIPALTIATALIIIWANILLVKPLLNARGIPYPDFEQLKTWKAPEILVWGFIASGIMLFLPAKPLLVIGLNCIIILMTVYFFQGIAIVSFYFEKKQLPRLLRFSLYSLGFIVLRQLLIFIVSLIGFFDIWIDFRKLENKIKNQES